MAYMKDSLGRRLDDLNVIARDSVPYGAVAQRVFGGRMATFDNSTSNTFQVTAEAPAAYDAVQVIFANTAPRYSYQVINAKVGSLATASDLNGNGSSTWKNLTGNNLSRILFRTSAGSNRIGYTVSDITPLQSVARSDAGTRPLTVVRAYMFPTAALPVVGNGTDSFANWATRSDGHLWAMRNQAVDGVNTLSNFTTTTNASQSPIVGIRWFLRGRVVKVAGVGDSITDGRGTYLGGGFGLPLEDSLSASALAVSWSNHGWSGQNSSLFFSRALDLLNSPNVRPDVLILPSGSPNDAPNLNDPLTQAIFDAAANMRARIVTEAQRVSVPVIFWTMLPCAPTVHNWDASDSYRRADNQRVLAMASQGVLVANCAADFETSLDADGQMGINGTYSTDGIHPNDAGYTKMHDRLSPLVAQAIGAPA